MSSAPGSIFGPLPLAICLAAGIALGDLLGAPASLAWLASLGFVIAGSRLDRLRAIAALLAAVCLGLGLVAPAPLRVPAGVIVDDRGVDRVEAVADGVVVTTRRGFGARLATSGDVVWVWTTERVLSGERIAVHGRVRTPRGAVGPGQP